MKIITTSKDFLRLILALQSIRHSSQALTQYVTVHVLLFTLAAMIGKMADEKEFDEKAASSDSEDGDDDEEDMSNEKNDVGDDESEFDDPEGFVDDITDEGIVLNNEHAGFRGKTETGNFSRLVV